MADYSDPSYAKQMVSSTLEVEISALLIFRFLVLIHWKECYFIINKCYFFHLSMGLSSSHNKIQSLFKRTDILPLRMAFRVLSKHTLNLFVGEDVVKFPSYFYLWSWAGNASWAKIHFSCSPAQCWNSSSSWLPDLPTGPFHQSVMLTTLS